ncbi:O-antigen ligase family protein [Vibrio sp. SCSIO 43136]|uniref:O-antigen ligase family protein n=1 Tax=Vibrio sp. SCSIO 43136 TaxID=2819101 RepID=UPI00207635EE|nr:O-antigen ligase family protein [Vibrio sp. SCSIO 43136]USD65136.1 O-antigen ligase family protein [Vibrio sp. SCSIO 43136]
MISFQSNKMSMLVSMLCFLYPATLLIAPYSYSWFAIPLLLLGLFSLFKTKHSLKSYVNLKWIYLAILTYYTSIAISLLFLGGPTSQFDLPSRSIFILPLIALVLAYPPKTAHILLGVAIGGIVSGIIAIYMHYVLGLRAIGDWGYMPIQTSGMAMGLALMSLVAVFYFLRTKDRIFTTIATLGYAGGLTASLLSGGRGAWVAAPVILLVLLLLNRQIITKQFIIMGLALMTCVSIISSPVVLKRTAAVTSDIVQLKKGEANTSNGARIEMWKAALYVGQKYPIFGAGYANLMSEKQQLVNMGKVDSVVLNYGRAHNQYLEAVQSRGAIGLISIILLLGAPSLYFWTQFKKNISLEINTFCLLGLTHLVSLAGCFLTQAYLSHHSGILFYTVFTGIFIALSTSPRENTQ